MVVANEAARQEQAREKKKEVERCWVCEQEWRNEKRRMKHEQASVKLCVQCQCL